MNKAEYSKLLKSTKWRAKRTKIIIRDNYKCTRCGETKKLQVHHVHYIEGRKPWQVPDHFLITVCPECHKFYHENNKISVIRLGEQKKPKPKKVKQKQVSKLKPPDMKGAPAHLREKIMQAYIQQRKVEERKRRIRDRKRNINTNAEYYRENIEI